MEETMPLVTTKNMLLAAREGRWAAGAFNAENMEMIQAIIASAEDLFAPVIIQTTPGTLAYGSPALFYANAAVLASSARVPVAIHLDHGNSLALAAQALRAGYTSIMIDGSREDLDGNIAVTRAVVEICGPNGVPVEGELGRVGGKEDDVEGEAGYTDPGEAARFTEETGVSSLAVGVGTAHGVYRTTPVLNTELISALKKIIFVPMVLHGASGLSPDAVRDCIGRGICKVNFATELRIAYTGAVKEYLEKNPAAIDPKKYGEYARSAVRRLVSDRIKVCGCDGRAGDVGVDMISPK
jgi:tagatose 1,6-diphosphate aldolase GatY/KbaY